MRLRSSAWIERMRLFLLRSPDLRLKVCLLLWLVSGYVNKRAAVGLTHQFFQYGFAAATSRSACFAAFSRGPLRERSLPAMTPAANARRRPRLARPFFRFESTRRSASFS